MIRTFNILSPLLALAAALVAAPLAADEKMTVTGQSLYQERVSFTDLDLRSWWDQQALRRRVYNASERVCIEAERPFDADVGFMGQPSCSETIYADTRPQIRTAIARAKAGQLLATSLVVSGPARTR